MRMDTAVGDETEEVETTAVGFGVFHGFDDLGGLVEFVLLNGCERSAGDFKERNREKRTLINLDDVLPHDSTGTNVQVSTHHLTSASLTAQPLRTTHPTSEFPINPSFNPTANPCASNSVKLWLSRIWSMLVVSPWKTAFPFSLSDKPHPS